MRIFFTLFALSFVEGFAPHSQFQLKNHSIQRLLEKETKVHAKRRKNDKQSDDFSSWYDDVEKGATPDDVFWSEIERQKAMSGVPSETETIDPFSAMNDMSTLQNQGIKSVPPTTANVAEAGRGAVSPNSNSEERATDKTLANYASFMVDDNWLAEKYINMMSMDDVDIEQQDKEIDKQFAELEMGIDDDDDERIDLQSLRKGSDPWDMWDDGTKSDLDRARDNDEDLDRFAFDPSKGEIYIFSLSLSYEKNILQLILKQILRWQRNFYLMVVSMKISTWKSIMPKKRRSIYKICQKYA